MRALNDRDIWLRCGTLFTPFQRLRDCILHIKEGKIYQILSAADPRDIPDAEIQEELDSTVAPGFIDLHVHGARGRDVMDGTVESLHAMSAALAAHGVTSFLATTLSASDSDTEVALKGFAAHHAKVVDGARPLGIHMEGPYLNPIRKGTHNATYLKPTEPETFRRFIEVSGNAIRKMTVAPEMDRGLKLIREALNRGIQISIGHSDASVEQAREAVNAGVHQATHVFNAMRPFHQREPGILGLVLTDNRVFAELIADGIHVHPVAMRLLWRVKGSDRTILVTDGLSAVDMPDGEYPLGNKKVIVRDGACRDPDGTLAGSTLTLDRAVRNLVEWLDVPLYEAIASASATPARSMKLDNVKGIIHPGADADLVFLDGDLVVQKTMVAGRIVYSRNTDQHKSRGATV